MQKSIEKLGHENSIIDDSRIILPKGTQREWLASLAWYKRCYVRLRQLFDCKSRVMRLQTRRYEDFRRRYLKVDSDYREFSELNDRYDLFIAGSDQIWYPDAEIFNPYYYLSFVSKKKISYAPSIGVMAYPEEYKERVKSLLSGFSHVSVREKTGADLLSSFTGMEIETVADPTLLLTAGEWDRVAARRGVSGRQYVLCYLLTYNEYYLQKARDFAEKHGLRLLIFATDGRYEQWADGLLYAGPSEFLRAVKDADYVMTDSYHATIFSFIYHRRVAVFKRFRDDAVRNQNSRLTNLFSLLGNPIDFIGEQDDISEEGLSYDSHSTDAALRIEAARSLKYLRSAIES